MVDGSRSVITIHSFDALSESTASHNIEDRIVEVT